MDSDNIEVAMLEIQCEVHGYIYMLGGVVFIE